MGETSLVDTSEIIQAVVGVSGSVSRVALILDHGLQTALGIDDHLPGAVVFILGNSGITVINGRGAS